MYLGAGLLVGIVGPALRLDRLSALHGIDYRGEVYQEGIAHGLDDMPVMFADSLPDDLVMNFEHPQHASFIAAHLTTKADDVRKHNRRQPPSLCGYRAAGVVPHK